MEAGTVNGTCSTFFERAQAYPEYTVDNGADAWKERQVEPKNNFT